ncbi:MAG: 3'-5' exonuclease domain-containing protein 2 [Spirochaetes bacterium]|nr:3'-5' exonuclease domain-containing protein 2 [Spirochaetota bacterium]
MEEFQYSISKDEINECDLGCFEGGIQLISDKDEAQVVINNLAQNTSILGFDTESKPSFRKGEFHSIALVQLATEENAYLFRINRMKIKPDFSPLFCNESILKIGLGLKDELYEIKKILGVVSKGFVDLEKIASVHKFHQRGVRALAAFFLQLRISKSAQKSNWERADLTDQQQKYAATDAWVCLEIYKSMLKKGFLPLENQNDMFVEVKVKQEIEK